MTKEKDQMQNQTNSAENSGGGKATKIINVIINVVLVVSIIFAAICTYVSFVNTSGNGVPSIFGLRLMSIQTPSMKPTINDGDLIIATKVDPEDLRPGDIVTYWTVINGERVLNTHRIKNIYDGDGFLFFETQGDANTSADPLTVHQKELVGKYQFRLPGIGKVFDYLKTGTGFFLIVVIPVFVFFIFHLVQFFRAVFEYQNVKNRIKFEMERDEADAKKAELESEDRKAAEMAALEAELREKLRAEIMADMAKESDPPAVEVSEETPAEPAAEETAEPAAEANEAPIEEVAEEPAAEETPAEVEAQEDSAENA